MHLADKKQHGRFAESEFFRYLRDGAVRRRAYIRAVWHSHDAALIAIIPQHLRRRFADRPHLVAALVKIYDILHAERREHFGFRGAVKIIIIFRMECAYKPYSQLVCDAQRLLTGNERRMCMDYVEFYHRHALMVVLVKYGDAYIILRRRDKRHSYIVDYLKRQRTAVTRIAARRDNVALVAERRKIDRIVIHDPTDTVHNRHKRVGKLSYLHVRSSVSRLS